MVEFNRETARHIARQSEEHRRRPQNTAKRPPPEQEENFPTIVVKSPSGGIPGPGAAQCQVQVVDAAGGLTNAGWLEDVVNIASTAISGDRPVVASKEDVSGYYIAHFEECP